MDMSNNNRDDIEYTVVLDGSYVGPDISGPEEDSSVQEDPKTAADRLYSEYEAMCLREPTVIDVDDAYPHSYYWRIGDRYDPEKIKVLEEAVKQGKRIADTEAFEEYSEAVRNRRFSPDSWE